MDVDGSGPDQAEPEEWPGSEGELPEAQPTGTSEPDEGEPGLGTTVPERSGPTVDAAVATAEEGSQVEGVHTPSGQAASGESRVERMADVPGLTEPPA